MALFLDYPVISTGNVLTAIDPYNANAQNNGALNVLGSLYAIPCSVANPGVNGGGSALIVKYVRYNSTANPALVAAPAPVYWTDETFTTVSGQIAATSEAVGSFSGVAGILLPNTTSVSGLTAATFNGSYCWIAISGFVAGVYATGASVVAGDQIVASATNWQVTRLATSITPGTGVTAKTIGFAMSAAASSKFDLLATLPIF